MATNLSIDPELIDRALKVSGERTKKGRRHQGAAGIYRTQAAEAPA